LTGVVGVSSAPTLPGTGNQQTHDRGGEGPEELESSAKHTTASDTGFHGKLLLERSGRWVLRRRERKQREGHLYLANMTSVVFRSGTEECPLH
jgi:hypothetical protein